MDRCAGHDGPSRPGNIEHVKYWIKPNIENRIKRGEVKALLQISRKEIRPRCRHLTTPEGEVTIKNDFVFAMTGYRPDLEFHGRTRHSRSNRHIRNRITDPETLESERKGVYLAGVIVAGMHTNEIFIENGRFHGRQIAEAIEESLLTSPVHQF